MKATLFAVVNRLSHENDWAVLTDHPDARDYGTVCCFLPPSYGETSLKACETWLANRGFTPAEDPFEYTC
jgi:hypothetical protein